MNIFKFAFFSFSTWYLASRYYKFPDAWLSVPLGVILQIQKMEFL